MKTKLIALLLFATATCHAQVASKPWAAGADLDPIVHATPAVGQPYVMPGVRCPKCKVRNCYPDAVLVNGKAVTVIRCRACKNIFPEGTK